MNNYIIGSPVHESRDLLFHFSGWCYLGWFQIYVYLWYTSTTPPQLIYKIYIYTRYSWQEKNLFFVKVIFSVFFSFWPILNLLQGIVGSVEGVGRVKPGNILLFLLLLSLLKDLQRCFRPPGPLKAWHLYKSSFTLTHSPTN